MDWQGLGVRYKEFTNYQGSRGQRTRPPFGFWKDTTYWHHENGYFVKFTIDHSYGYQSSMSDDWEESDSKELTRYLYSQLRTKP